MQNSSNSEKYIDIFIKVKPLKTDGPTEVKFQSAHNSEVGLKA